MYPMLFERLVVNAEELDRDGWGAPMRKQADKLFPEPCRGCKHAQFVMNGANNRRLLMCNRPLDCPEVEFADFCEGDPSDHFLDVQPMLGDIPSESNCLSCPLAMRHYDASTGHLYHQCGRREGRAGLSTPECPVTRGVSRADFLDEKRHGEQRQLDSELSALELIESQDAGVF